MTGGATTMKVATTGCFREVYETVCSASGDIHQPDRNSRLEVPRVASDAIHL